MFVGSANMARFLYGSLAVILSIGLLWINCAVHTAPAIGTLGEMQARRQPVHPCALWTYLVELRASARDRGPDA